MSLATTIAIMNSYNETINALPGVEKDKKKINNMFSGTTIKEFYDKTREDLIDDLIKIDVKTEDIIIYYAGHGYQNEHTIPGITTTDLKKILITEIMNILRSKYSDKNLYIIMDSCRTEAKNSPVMFDRYVWNGIFLIFHPTRGGAGTSEHTDGSVYMKCLTEQKGFKTNIVPTLYETSILYKNDRLSKYNETKDERYKSQMPEFYVNSMFRTIYPAYTEAIKLLCANNVEATKYGRDIATTLTDAKLRKTIVILRLRILDTKYDTASIIHIIKLLHDARPSSTNELLNLLKIEYEEKLKEIKTAQESEQNEIKTTEILISNIITKIISVYPEETKNTINIKLSHSEQTYDNINKCVSIIHKRGCDGISISTGDTNTLANLLIKYTLINKIPTLKVNIVKLRLSDMRHNLKIQTIETNIKIIDDCIVIMKPTS